MALRRRRGIVAKKRPAGAIQRSLTSAVEADAGLILVTNAVSYNTVVSADNPLHHWKLGANGNDRIGTKHFTGTAATFGASSLVNNNGTDAAASFSGGGELQTDATSPATYLAAPFTIEAWVRPAAIGSAKLGIIAFMNAGGGSQRYGMNILTSGLIEFYHRLADGNYVIFTAPEAAVTGATYHLVHVWNGSTLVGYVNGQLAGSAAAASINTVSTQVFHLGGEATANFMNGVIDEVAWYPNEFTLLKAQQHYAAGGGRVDLALGKAVTSSGEQSGAYLDDYAVDGSDTTRWASQTTGGASAKWLRVDLGAAFSIGEVSINWEAAYAPSYLIETSLDGTSWTTAASVSISAAGDKTTTFSARNARYVRITAVTESIWNLISFWRLSVYSSVAPPVQDLTVFANRTTSNATSKWNSGYTNVNRQWLYPWGGQEGPYTNSATSQGRAYAREAEAIKYKNTHIMAWGVDQLWPTESADPPDFTAANESNVYYQLDRNVKAAVDHGVTPVITLAMAPTWMVGRRTAGNGVVIPGPGPIVYDSRVLTDKLPKWLQLVDAITRRYVQAPYNVRIFQVWNELKGFYNPDINDQDTGNTAGTAGKADMGYAYFYNQTRAQILDSAAAVGVTTGIRTGGPYAIQDWNDIGASMSHPVVDGYGSSNDVLSGNKSYGKVDSRALKAIKDWLQHCDGEFIVLRFSQDTRQGNLPGDPWDAMKMQSDLATWVRGLPEATYSGSTTLPFFNAEWYTSASPTGNTDLPPEHINAHVAVGNIVQAKSGYEVALRWGSTGLDNVDIWTSNEGVGATQDNPLIAGFGYEGNSHQAFQDMQDNFGAGVALYPVTVSDPSKIEAIASASKIMVVNKTAQSQAAVVQGASVTLTPYEVRVITA